MFEIDQYAFHQVIRTLMAGIAALFFSDYFLGHEDGWIIFSSLCLVQVRGGYLVQYQLIVQLIFGIGIAAVVLIAGYVGNSIFYLSIVLAGIVYLSIYYGFRYNLFFPAFLISFLAILSGCMPVYFSEACARSGYILVGLCISLLVTSALWPDYVSYKTYMAKIKSVRTCLKLFLNTFDIYLNKDYFSKHLQYEKKIYYLSQAFFYWIKVYKKLNEYGKEKRSKEREVHRIEKIFDIITALGGLRYKVSDHSTFGMIERELREIQLALVDKFNCLLQNKKANKKSLEDIYDRFEEVYRSALQVAAQEPIMYLFFVNHLRALDQELDYFYG